MAIVINSVPDVIIMSVKVLYEHVCCIRVATHLENLEKSGNSKMVREKSGKMEKVRETSIILDFERAEELKLQLLAACGPGLWICSSLTLL